MNHLTEELTPKIKLYMQTSDEQDEIRFSNRVKIIFTSLRLPQYLIKAILIGAWTSTFKQPELLFNFFIITIYLIK